LRQLPRITVLVALYPGEKQDKMTKYSPPKHYTANTLKSKGLTVINMGVENLFEKYFAKKWGNVEEIITFVLKFQIRQFFNAFYRRISS
jgi:hypothetical protein